ncbi:MAG: 50S ribosomal protein L6 [Kofleriaceae bacterium]|jgi:large subunit ribosomal protein L6|nr:50S ribosomal protein L6 [Kofleriaceae bacterium]MBP9171504.1 50S ribosomal protein L6 [Kofleriaceae bacterium]MBP9858787.1 50S ribosomal protein L6 [Kofleriaceae bacterium]
MSRIGNRAIEIPKGVTISIKPELIEVKGPKGTLSAKRHASVEIKEASGSLVFTRSGNTTSERAAHGLMRALTNNLITGVTKGFERTLEINGVGYRAEVKGANVVLTLGYSHPIEYKLPEGVSAKVDKNNLILSAMDKQLLGAAAAKLRSFRAPEPYKGKGVKYAEETIIRKAGKAAGKGK